MGQGVKGNLPIETHMAKENKKDRSYNPPLILI